MKETTSVQIPLDYYQKVIDTTQCMSDTDARMWLCHLKKLIDHDLEHLAKKPGRLYENYQETQEYLKVNTQLLKLQDHFAFYFYHSQERRWR